MHAAAGDGEGKRCMVGVCEEGGECDRAGGHSGGQLEVGGEGQIGAVGGDCTRLMCSEEEAVEDSDGAFSVSVVAPRNSVDRVDRDDDDAADEEMLALFRLAGATCCTELTDSPDSSADSKTSCTVTK